MNLLKTEQIAPPPGIISSIKSGFDATANHLDIIIFPILLDLFLWLGPQLRLDDLFRNLVSDFAVLAEKNLVPLEEVERVQATLKELLALDVNLFTLLRTFPIGISSLMSRTMTGATPFGEAASLQVESPLGFFLWLIFLTFVGWALGSLYFTWAARRVLVSEEKRGFVWAVKIILQAILLALAWAVLLIIIGMPLLLVFSIFMQINAGLAQAALIFLAFFAMWFVVPVFFSAHGIFVNQENLFRSVLSSFRLSRFTLPASSFFVLSVIVISQGLNFLWLTPATSSWMMLIGIVGHAFITTALLAASFIYYRDMKIWVEILLDKISSDENPV